MTTGQPAPRVPGNRPSDRVLVIHRRLMAACAGVHLLVVDDNSPDGTGQLADELAAADPDRVHVMHRTAKDGLGAAYLAGFAWGLSRDYSVLVEMDADGSHAPEQLHLLLDAVDAGADLAIGSRYVDGGAVRNWPWRRWALSWTANTYARVALGVGVHDITAGYRAYRREVLERIPFQNNSNDFVFDTQFLVQAVRLGFRLGDIPVPVRYFPEASSINFIRSVNYGFRTLAIIAEYWLDRLHLRRSPLFKTV